MFLLGSLAVALLFLPLAAFAGVFVWARRLRGRKEIPGAAAWSVYLLAAFGSLTLLRALAFVARSAAGLSSDGGVDPSQQARVLAEGISVVMNCGALALLLIAGAAGWLLFWRWRGRR